ncbi:malate synthase A [Acidothermaceae bacterium B102]|nr:malate synthase A [Acidothermaceae bacterium B102]
MTSNRSSHLEADAVVIDAPDVPGTAQVLTQPALDLLAALHHEFGSRRLALLAERTRRQRRLDQSGALRQLSWTTAIRADHSWRVAPPAPGLRRRHVEMTGPVSRSMAINALNSGADVWMADFEDATSPTWANVIEGQLNLLRFTRGELGFTNESGKRYEVGEQTPTVMVRPRGWHLEEKHVLVDGQRISASLTDIGLYFHHCAQAMIDRGAGPYFYLPKLESHLEARLWNDVFVFLQEWYAIPRGTVRATALIETIQAAFEMEEILYELREHSAGLNAGRWDYIFSIIKTFQAQGEEYVLPDRADITMTTPFMRAYTERLVATCHRRGAHAIGGMAAYVPNRRDAEATAHALQRIRAEKDRDAADGFDGSWVAHPGLVATAATAFELVLHDRDHQIKRLRTTIRPPSEMLDLTSAGGRCTLAGLRSNISVSLRYLEAWLCGSGAVAINNLMEDAATVEISRSQVWQWLAHNVVLEDGTKVTEDLVRHHITLEADEIRGCQAGTGITLADAVALFEQLVLEPGYLPFFTQLAYNDYLRD